MSDPKPMRIRYMELPSVENPETKDLYTPFAIIVDRAGNIKADEAQSLIERLKHSTGARGVSIFPGDVQIGDDY